MTIEPLWTSDAMAAAMHAAGNGALPQAVSGISIDSRSITPGEAYFAIKGDVHDGHAFVAAALNAGAALAVVETAQREKFAADAPLLVVDDVLASLVDLSRASRARLGGRVVAVTGSVGKTSTKEALLRVFSRARQDPRFGGFVQQSLGRAAVAGALSGCKRFRDFRDRHEPCRRDRAAGQTGAAAYRHHHQPSSRCIWSFFAGIEAIADAKAEIFAGLEPGGAAVLNRDNAQFDRLRRRAEKLGVSRIVTFGANEASDARLIDVSLHAACSAVHAQIMGHEVTYKLGMPGRHMAMNSLAVMAAAQLAGADLALAGLNAIAGAARGRPRRPPRPGGCRRRSHPGRREL